MRTLKNLVENTWDQDVRFLSAYPGTGESSSLELPIITYKIYEKVPGSFGNTSEIKPRIRYELNLKDVNVASGKRLYDYISSEGVSQLLPPGSNTINAVEILDSNDRAIEVWGQMFDYTIEFEVWASSGEEADNLAQEFQTFMFKYTGYLKKLGVDRIFFQRLSQGDPNNRWRTDLVSRSMFYHFRLDEIVGIEIPTIKNIFIDEPTVAGGYKIFFQILEELKLLRQKNDEEE